jgi:hypothetical protein
MADIDTLKVSKKLTTKLKEIGTKGETYEDIIWRLITGSKKEEEKVSAKKYNEDERRAGVTRRARKATIVEEGKWKYRPDKKTQT